MIAGQQHHAQPAGLQRGNRRGRIVLDLVCHADHAGQLGIDAYQNAGGSLLPGSFQAFAGRIRHLNALGFEPAAPAHYYAVPMHLPAHASTGLRSESGNGAQRCCGGRGSGNALGNRMLGIVLHRAGGGQHAGLVESGESLDTGHAHGSGGYRAGLVQHHGGQRAGVLQHLRAADQDAQLGGASGADQQPDGGGQAQRARAGNDQHRNTGAERAVHITASQPPDDESQQCNAQHHRNEHGADAVGQPGDLRLAGLRLGNQLAHLCQRGGRAHPGGLHQQPAGGIDRGAGDCVPGAHGARHRFAGQQRGVHGAGSFEHRAVGGELLAGTHYQYIAHGHLACSNALLDPVTQDHRALGTQREQCGQRIAGLGLGPVLQVAAEQQQCGHYAGGFEIQRVAAHGHASVRGQLRAGQQLAGREEVRGQHAQGDQGVHGR